MAKKVTKKPICDACGADVRAGSLYCYNCGGPVAPESKASAGTAAKASVSDAWFKSELTQTPKRITTKLVEPEATVIEDPEIPIPKPGIYEEAKLKTAASLRRKGKSIDRKRIEVVWEEPDRAPDGRFILAAFALTLIVVVIFFAASYLK
jgi:hypothetical protein